MRAAWLAAVALVATPANGGPPELGFVSTDRLLVVAAHPGDEVVAAGGLLQRAVQKKCPVRVVIVTDGRNDDWSLRPHRVDAPVPGLADVRRDEAVAAARLLGLKDANLAFLDHPDFELLPLLLGGDAGLLEDLSREIREFRPTKIVLPHPADDMLDGPAVYILARVAMWDSGLEPEVLPALVHFDAALWPRPEGYSPDDPLPPPPFFDAPVDWRRARLSRKQTEAKYAAIQAHRTGFRGHGRHVSSYARATEIFGDFPALEAASIEGASAHLSRRDPPLRAPHGELAPDERKAFVGIERRSIGLEGTDIVQKILLTREVPRGAAVSVYLVGYRPDLPFASMPKLRVAVERGKTTVFDRREKVIGAGVSVTRKGRELTVRAPLAGLGYPGKLLTSVRTHAGSMPLDTTAWRLVEGLPRP